ncbi:MAG: iron-containing alcohol dehydrogenase [Pseudomonadota bacterium]
MSDLTLLPSYDLGPGTLSDVPATLQALGLNGAVLVVADPICAALPAGARLMEELGARARLFTPSAGEPSAADIETAAAQARRMGAGAVIGLGGGTALDIAKVASACAVGAPDPDVYALCQTPLPAATLPKILIPTTAGTGSEANGTAIFSNRSGKKLWVYGPELKPVRAVLDPDLTTTLPAHLVAWCGLDALVHAFEACTNANASDGCQPFALEALRLIAGAIETAGAPGKNQARADMLLGSFYAGYAIENCGTSVAHLISHALASKAPIHHGLATALAFEATLPWVTLQGGPRLAAACDALGTTVTDLPKFISHLMDRLGVVRALPPAFADLSPRALAEEMRAKEHAPMRNATLPHPTDQDLDGLAAKLLSAVKVPA